MRELIKPVVRSNFKPAIFNGISKAIEYVAQTDGATQYWQLSDPISVLENQNYKQTFYVQGSRSNFEGVFEGFNTWLRFIDQANIDFFQHYGQLTVGGTTSTVIDLNGVNPRDGNINKLSIIRTGGITYSQINDGAIKQEGSSFNGAFEISALGKYASSYFLGVIYGFEFEIDGVITNLIPLTNKAQGATQLATVGNVNAFMPNYTESVWKDKSKL